MIQILKSTGHAPCATNYMINIGIEIAQHHKKHAPRATN